MEQEQADSLWSLLRRRAYRSPMDGGARNHAAGPGRCRVLGYLVQHPGRTFRGGVSEHVWPRTYVSTTTLRGCVWAIRRPSATRRPPQYIETIGHKGYRFLAETRDGAGGVRPRQRSSGHSTLQPPPGSWGARPTLHLQACLAQAQRGCHNSSL